MFGGLRSDARSRELVHPVLRDETNAMAITGTPENCPEVSENRPSGILKVHPKIGYLHVTDYTRPWPPLTAQALPLQAYLDVQLSH